MGDVQKEEYVLQDLYINEIERKPCENCEGVVQLCHDQVIAPYFFADQMVVGISCNMEYNIS